MYDFTYYPDTLITVTDLTSFKTLSATPEHPKFDEIVERLRASEFEGIEALFDLTAPIRAVMATTEGVSLVNGVVFYKGKEVEGPLVDHILALDNGGFPTEAWVNFMERLERNPSFRSRAQLFEYVRHNGLTISKDGRILLDKGVTSDYFDCHTGTISNKVGQIVEMDRRLVDDDPNSACSSGLHAGNYDYVKGFGVRKMLVAVCPSDVVSVPHDENCTKVRCCKYEVIAELEADTYLEERPYKGPYYYYDDFDDYDLED